MMMIDFVHWKLIEEEVVVVLNGFDECLTMMKVIQVLLFSVSMTMVNQCIHEMSMYDDKTSYF